MEKNMGCTDRGIRIAVALIIAALYYYQVIGGTFGNVLLTFSALFLITGFTKFCPLYALLGIKTTSSK
ncbi:MAG: DUF2892 domain-containing protein [Eudoraea sp.]|nr:DUF2892 domain-containing protein [Eudoraea sp.]